MYLQTQTNMYEVVMEMNSRQLLVESRVDGIEDTLRSLKVRKFVTKFHLVKKTPATQFHFIRWK